MTNAAHIAAGPFVARAGELGVAELFATGVRLHPDRPAVQAGARVLTHAALAERAARITSILRRRGIGRGDRVAILAENAPAHLECALAAARLGVAVCLLNWRLAAPELEYCVRLTAPSLLVASARYRAAVNRLGPLVPEIMDLEGSWEEAIARAPPDQAPPDGRPEDGLVILFTSGTTGLPKAAVVSQRAVIARMLVGRLDHGLQEGDAFVAWPPMFHMASMDQSLAVLLTGGKVVVTDGFDEEAVVRAIADERQWWLFLFPGMIEPLLDRLQRERVRPKGLRLVGVMADLVPRHQLAAITRALDAPYCNSFGATETGLPPASASLIPIGTAPERLPKRQSSLCSIRLVDADDRDVPDGEPGELVIRGPTLFSGYWNDPAANDRDFRDGWFHMGDVFVRHADGTLDFVDRRKYLIKSGGENVYPAEIERVLLADPRVSEAAVVRRPDARWGEVPVAFVATSDPTLREEELLEACGKALARYKLPKAIRFIAEADFPRSATGKVQRHELEARLAAEHEEKA